MIISIISAPGARLAVQPFARKYPAAISASLAAGAPWPDPAYTCVASFVCDSLEPYRDALFANIDALQGDVANFTDTTPVIQIGELQQLALHNRIAE